MASLPTVSGDNNVWGTKLNNWLLVGHNADGTTLGGSQPAVRYLDLGIVTIAELLADGEKTLYTPASEEFMLLVYGESDIVAPDAYAQIGFEPWFTKQGLSVYLAAGGPSPWGASQDQGYISGHNDLPPGWYASSQPIKAFAAPGGLRMVGALGSWQPSHAYVVGSMIDDGDGFIWAIIDGPGTSGTDEPTFNDESQATATDNDLSWYFLGARQSNGSAHIYALVATPSSP